MLCLLGRDVWAGGALSAGRTSDSSDDIAVGVQAALGGIGVAVGAADRGELVLRVDGGGDEGQHGGAEHGVRRGLSVAVYVGANEPGAQQRRRRSDLKHMAGTPAGHPHSTCFAKAVTRSRAQQHGVRPWQAQAREALERSIVWG